MSGPFGSQHWMYASGGFYSYSIDQSLRFDAASESELSRTFASGGNRRKWTFSTWIKRTTLTPSGNDDYIFGIRTAANNASFMFLNWRAGDDLIVTGQSTLWLRSDRVFRDVGAWYHIVWSLDTDNSTASQRMRLYVNGSELTSFSTDSRSSLSGDQAVNAAAEHNIGRHPSSTGYGLGAYLAETHFIDGQAYDPSYFGETSNGIWVPKAYSGSYGTTGFYLSYANSSAIGDDLSGNTNDFTATNLAASDVVPDSPTNNFGTMNPLDKNSMTVSEGNLKVVPSGDYKAIRGTFGIPTSGKWYFEARILTPGGGNVQDNQIGVTTQENVLTGSSPYPQAFTYGVGYIGSGQINRGGSAAQTSLTAFTAGKILGVAVNVDDDEVQFYLDGSAVGTTHALVSTTEPNFAFYVGATNRGAVFNFGQDSTFAGAISAGGNADANGIGDFAYAPPANHLALCTSNLSDSTIGPNSGVNEQADDYFETVLYAGTGSTQSITGIFQPDFVWIKARDGAGSGRQHMLFDSIRGATKVLRSHLANDEVTVSTSLTSFNSDGFTIGGDSDVNTNSENFVAWNWKAGGTAVSNSNGTITSSVSADQGAGFSIATWTGNQSAGATVGHGLSQKPEMYWVKARGASASWAVYHSALGATKWMLLNSTQGVTTTSQEWNNTEPTSTVVSLGTSSANSNQSATYVGYFFHSVEGYCKVDSYTGNGSSDGTFVFTGFRPAWVIIKRTASGGWHMFDNKRAFAGNEIDVRIEAQDTGQENTSGPPHIDFVSNGFKLRTTFDNMNASGGTYIYLAFAEAPFKYANAR